MSKHTPGPWAVNCTTFGGAITHWHITGKRWGSIYPICAHIIEVEPSGSEQIANARLIAAAPELLELFEIIIANAVIGPDASMGGTTDCYHVPTEDIDCARMLISKAKGEQP